MLIPGAERIMISTSGFGVSGEQPDTKSIEFCGILTHSAAAYLIAPEHSEAAYFSFRVTSTLPRVALE